jgi:hypothetical protein
MQGQRDSSCLFKELSISSSTVVRNLVVAPEETISLVHTEETGTEEITHRY